MAAEVAVAAKFDYRMRPCLMQILHDPAQYAEDVQRFIASSRSKQRKDELAVHPVEDYQWHIAVLIVIVIEQRKLLRPVGVGVGVIHVKNNPFGRFGKRGDILLDEQLPDLDQRFLVHMVFKPGHCRLGTQIHIRGLPPDTHLQCAVVPQTIAVVGILVSAHYLTHALTYHFFVRVPNENLVPVIRNQTGDLAGYIFLFKSSEDQSAIGRDIRGIEIHLDFPVRKYIFKRKKCFFLTDLWICCIFAHKNACIKFIFSTLKLMLFLHICKRGVLFLWVYELFRLKTEYAKKLAAAKGNAAEQARLKEQFERESASIQEKYAIQAAQSAIAMIEEQLKTENLSVEEREELARKLAQAKAQLAQQVADAEVRASEEAVKADNEATAKRIANAQQWLQVAADSLNAINDLVSTIYDAKISKVEEEQEANTEAGEVEQERIAQMVEQNVITEEEGEARKRAAEDKTAKKNEELEKKKAKLKEKQAKFDKLNSIAQCGIATAIAIMNALQMQPFPVGIAMAAIAAAMGAVQLATIIATPLPKYAKGTSHHKGGPAIVGDGGVPEVITYGGNAWITPDKPTLVDLPAGASVIPDVSNLDESELAVVRPLMQGGKDAPKPYNDAKVIDRLDNLIFIKQRESRARRLSDIDSQLASYLISKSV